MTLSRKAGPADDALALVVGPARPLPVAWDGVPVEWTPWENPPHVSGDSRIEQVTVDSGWFYGQMLGS